MIRWMLVMPLLSGCFSLDGLAFPSLTTDAYQLPFAPPADQVEPVTFTTSDGLTLYGAWLHQSPPAPPLIYFHGYSGNLDTTAERVDYYWGWGTHDVFVFDYRGYGRSEGVSTIDGVLEEDGLAAVQYVSQTTGVAPDQIPWMALSLGAEVALHTNDEVAAELVVAESALASIDDIVDDETGLDLPDGWFFQGEFDDLEAIARIVSPVLLIHGLDDDFINPRYSAMLYDQAPDPRALWQPEGVGHSDAITVLPEEYRAQVDDFRASLTLPP